MPCNTIRNLDIATLRSFVTVAELGGVTRAAERLNLTQSAVSMQLKRLETVLDQQLVERAAHLDGEVGKLRAALLEHARDALEARVLLELKRVRDG